VILLAAVVVASLLTGYAAAEAVWSWERTGDAHPAGPFERTAAAVTAAYVALLMASWALAMLHVYRTVTLAGVVLAMGAVSAVWAARRVSERGRALLETKPSRAAIAMVVLFVPIVLWVELMAYRGWLLPVTGHDGLSYHLPRAVLIIRDHGYAFFDSTSMTISAYPANYEMLLADFIVLAGDDRGTEWVCAASYVHLLLLSAALAERFWGRGLHVAAVVFLTALVPVTLLHTGAHKNDLLMSSFLLASMLWSARWAARGGLAAFLFAYASVSGAVGTKLSAPFMIAGLVPLVAWRVRASLRQGPWLPAGPRRVAVVALVLAMTFLLGSAVYLVNLRVLGTPFPTKTDFGFDEGYGDWANVWRFPFLAFTRPFTASDWGVYVPWTRSTWFWPRFNLYFGNLGVSTTVLLVLVPFGVWRYRADGDPEARRERAFASLVGLVTFLLIMPIRSRPLGFFGMFTRYIMWLPPLLAAWTAAPAMRELTQRLRAGPKLAWAGLVGLVGLFLHEASQCAHNDAFGPLAYVAKVMDHPELDRALLRPNAAEVLDRVAGPDAVVAFDGVVDAWIYPTFGRNLTRRVIPVHLVPGVRWEIPPEVEWVVIDRNWNAIWANPALKTMGDARSFLFKGTPKPIDLQLFRQLKEDPEWKLVFRYVPLQQSVFRRVRPGEAPAPPPPG
jgi:hypothetical protein